MSAISKFLHSRATAIPIVILVRGVSESQLCHSVFFVPPLVVSADDEAETVPSLPAPALRGAKLMGG
jgi:hypothetical protein